MVDKWNTGIFKISISLLISNVKYLFFHLLCFFVRVPEWPLSVSLLVGCLTLCQTGTGFSYIQDINPFLWVWKLLSRKGVAIYHLLLWEMIVSPAVSLGGHARTKPRKKVLDLEFFFRDKINKNPKFFLCFFVLSFPLGQLPNPHTGFVIAVVAGGRLESFLIGRCPFSHWSVTNIFTITPVLTITT